MKHAGSHIFSNKFNCNTRNILAPIINKITLNVYGCKPQGYEGVIRSHMHFLKNNNYTFRHIHKIATC